MFEKNIFYRALPNVVEIKSSVKNLAQLQSEYFMNFNQLVHNSKSSWHSNKICLVLHENTWNIPADLISVVLLQSSFYNRDV